MASTRRLTAILAADVAGYSRLMEADEEGTLERLKTLRRELSDPKIKEHRGRIVKTTGDGLLVEFGSVVDAVRCAIEVQGAMSERNAGVPPAQRIDFRVGINLGDIIRDKGDIFGDGVNIAARLEALAEPGGICVSGAAHDQVRDKLAIAFEDGGEQSLKNIARPVHVYRVKMTAPAPEPRPALALPHKPSLAVLPFENMSGDPEQEYFADGMVEDIITALSRIRWLFVIARNSSFTYKGKAVDVKQVGRELGVRYVLEGSVRKGGNRVRITGQLIDTANGAHIWADRFDGALDDIFELQDRVASSVAGAIEPKLMAAEMERASRKPTEHLDAYDFYLRARARGHHLTEVSYDEAVALLRQALAIDPSYAPAAAMLAFCRTQQQAQGWGGLTDADFAESARLARQAIDAKTDDPDTMWQAAWPLYRFAGERAVAMAVLDRAVTLNPNASLAWLVRGWVQARHGGQPELAIEDLNRALRLSPLDPLGFFFTGGLAVAHFAARRFEEAIQWADRSSHDQPLYIIPIHVKTAASAHLGRLDEARAGVARMLAVHPGSTLAAFRALFGPAIVPEVLDLYIAGLRLAGLPEGEPA